VVVVGGGGDTINNRGKGNHCKIIQKIPEQHTGKAQNQGTKKNQPNWALHTYIGKYYCKSTEHSKCEITLYVAEIVNTE
jgi:hypothetical protein